LQLARVIRSPAILFFNYLILCRKALDFCSRNLFFDGIICEFVSKTVCAVLFTYYFLWSCLTFFR
jgi:hypothetical protein